MLEANGHTSVAKFPAIAALKTPPEAVRALKGQRAECAIALQCEGKTLREERGEILFAETGVSGIASMQLARACGEALKAGKKCAVRMNLLGDADAFDMLCDRVEKLPKRAMEDFLNGIVSKRVGMALVKLAGVEMTQPAESLKTKELRALADVLTGWTIPVTGVQGFEQAQVTAGGISLKDFDWDTMESKRVPGLYAAGEVLDVDGDCGGFNLQWAWASALIAAKAMMRV
jgi:predicted Rossmann fold flavoprotein